MTPRSATPGATASSANPSAAATNVASPTISPSQSIQAGAVANTNTAQSNDGSADFEWGDFKFKGPVWFVAIALVVVLVATVVLPGRIIKRVNDKWAFSAKKWIIILLIGIGAFFLIGLLLGVRRSQLTSVASSSPKVASEPSKDVQQRDTGTHNDSPATGLKLLGHPTVVIDASNGGTTQLALLAGEDGTYSIRSENFKSSVTQQFLNASVNFSDSSASTTTAFIATKNLKKNDRWILKVDVGNFNEAGEAKANLVDGDGKLIGELTAVRLQFPFGVKLETSNPEKPELSLTRGQNPTITLQNDDTFSYPVLYHFSIDGLRTSESTVQLSPKGAQSINFGPPPAWFNEPVTGIFKSAERSGRLTLSYDPANVSQKTFLPTKSIPVTFHLNYWPDWVPAVMGTVILLGVLTLGGLASLFVSCGIPNKQRQVQLREQILSLARRISAVSPSVDSRLRVLLRLELKNLEAMLQTRHPGDQTIIRDPMLLLPEWALPDFADTLDAVAAGLAKLEIRVNLSEELDRLRHVLEGVSDQLPPTIIEQVNSDLQETADRARKPQLAPEEIALAKSLLAKAEALMTTWAQDTVFGADISSRLKRVRGLLGVDTADPNRLDETEVCKRFKTTLPNTFQLLDNQNLLDPANIAPADYTYLDTATFKLDLAIEYSRFFQSVSADRQQALQQRENFLLDALTKDSWPSLKYAQTLVREAKSGIYPEELRTELLAVQGANGQGGRVSIELDRQSATQAEPVELGVQFHNRLFRCAPALDEWTPLWNFEKEPPDGTALRERWWTVWHYFDNSGDYNVKVHFEGVDGKPISDDQGSTLYVTKTIQVLPSRQSDKRERLRAEILKLGIALFVALIALLGGARDQLAKLDVIQGLLAVFVMGFGANVVKDLITQKSQSVKQSS